MKKLLPLVLTAVFIAACGPTPTPTPNVSATTTAIAKSIVATMTAQAPTATPTPTPKPLPTPVPTDTPKPTSTPTETPTLPPTPSVFKVGDVVKLEDAIVTVTGIDFSEGDSWNVPDEGKVYLLVHLHIENAGFRELSVNPFHFKVQDSNGVIVDQAFVTFVKSDLHAVDLAPGGKIDGTVPFEVQQGDENLQLIYQPNIFVDTERMVIELGGSPEVAPPTPVAEVVTPSPVLPTSTPVPPTPTTQPVGLEQNVTAGTWQFHVEWVKREKVVHCAYGNPQVAQGMYAIVRLWVTNLSSGTDAMYKTLDLVVYDDKGRVSKELDFDTEFCASWQWCCAGDIYDDFNPGIESPVTVVWDIAPDTEYLFLQAIADDGSVSTPIALGHFSEIAAENPY